MNQKDILLSVMEEALENSGYYGTYAAAVSQRDLYYSARELYFAHPDFPQVEAKMEALYAKKGKTKPGGPAAIAYDYFCNDVLVAYEERNGKLDRLIRDVRGHLYEPHSGKLIEISTTSVMEYGFPELVFDKLLYIEKEGEMGKVRQARLAEKYDMAILTGKGFPAEAIRNLLTSASDGHDYQIFCFHDADADGYDITRCLREETRRMPGYSVEVTDIGLTVADAEDMGLRGEPYTRQKTISGPLLRHLTDHELEVLGGEKVSGNTYRAYRYELNSINPPQKRMDYIEAGLEAVGAGKVMPSEDRARSELVVYRDEDLAFEIGAAVDELVDRDAIVSNLTETFSGRYGLDSPQSYIEGHYAYNPYSSWRSGLRRFVEDRSHEIRDEIRAGVEGELGL